MEKFYAGIGSREIPSNVHKLINKISKRLCEDGYTLRSGGANGADTAFEEYSNRSNIYLPYDRFNGRIADNKNYFKIDENTEDHYDALYSLKYHKYGSSLTGAPKKMMIRNYYQVCGHNKLPHSSFIICWTKDGADGKVVTTTKETGGTGQAIRIATALDIPVFNLNSGELKYRHIDDIFTIIYNHDKVTTINKIF